MLMSPHGARVKNTYSIFLICNDEAVSVITQTLKRKVLGNKLSCAVLKHVTQNSDQKLGDNVSHLKLAALPSLVHLGNISANLLSYWTDVNNAPSQHQRPTLSHHDITENHRRQSTHKSLPTIKIYQL